ncbi:phage tail protein [Paraburkholderia saeva]|uniref:Phage tail protein n=1 Tax=Paraburkholderia saeva TaxID=2777537 RepID=A0A9N8X3X3_9BURK|nr:phage tail protein [Paraburkholderia saeva]CAG4905995.1 hypothetical protein LMG31841_03512 [Paraburkholderia saeva]
MDYPQDPSVGLVDGKFVDENEATAQVGSLIPSSWGNSVTDEIINVQNAAGIEADEAAHDQLLKALRKLFPAVYSISALPTENIGPVTVIEAGEVWLWSASAFFTGYRSPLCGRPLDGHTVTPLASEVDAVGGNLSKTAYAALWGYANENSLVVTSANWVAGTHNFVDNGDNTFRGPDLRNMFRRYTGTDADTANARNMGSAQTDTFQGHRVGNVQTASGGSAPTNLITTTVSNQGGSNLTNALAGVYAQLVADTHGMPRTGNETRPLNTAFRPRIHI